MSFQGACLRLTVLLSCTELRKRTAPLGLRLLVRSTPRSEPGGTGRQRTTLIMASETPIRVAIIGLGFGAEFIPIYQNYPGAEMYAICRRDQQGPGRVRRPLQDQGPLHRLSRAAQGPEHRRGPHQLADPRPRLDVDRGPQGRQARRLHRADGHVDRRVPADRRGPARRAARST